MALTKRHQIVKWNNLSVIAMSLKRCRFLLRPIYYLLPINDYQNLYVALKLTVTGALKVEKNLSLFV